MRTLTREILEKGASFTFAQVMRLLRQEFSGTLTEDELAVHLRVRPHLGMGHPATDVRAVQATEDPEDRRAGFEVTANFLGLYGAGTPLPTFYTEDLFDDEKEGREVTRDFLDVLNNGFYHHLFRILSKHRLYLRLFEQSDDAVREWLFSLIGLSPLPFRRRPQDYHFLRYASVYMQHPRCSAGLKSIAADVLESREVEIDQCCRRQVVIAGWQRIRLGSENCTLGVDAHLGLFMKDRTGKLRIRSQVMGREEFRQMLPGAPRFLRLRTLVQAYVDTPLKCEVAVRVAPADVPAASLGTGWARLGYETWCYSGAQMDGCKEVRFRL